MSDRGIKKWNAYKALPEHDSYLEESIHGRYKVEKPIVSEEEAEIINRILVHYHGQKVRLTYYRDRSLYKVDDIISKIDTYYRLLLLKNNGTIKLSELVGLKELE